jgi:hypothetical protein
MSPLISRNSAIILSIFGALIPVQGQAAIDQQSVVFIVTQCEDLENGGIFEPEGTGFVIERKGYIVTAFHVVACHDPQSNKRAQRKEIFGRIGSRWEPNRNLELINGDAQSDVAILRIRGYPRDYASLKACSLRNPPPHTPFDAAGFPEGRDYQPVSGLIGNVEAGGGRWSVASPFAHGMSGGPVTYKGVVIGIVKGGLRNVAAVSTITPIHMAKPMIESATGVGVPECAPCDGGRALGSAGGRACIEASVTTMPVRPDRPPLPPALTNSSAYCRLMPFLGCYRQYRRGDSDP